MRLTRVIAACGVAFALLLTIACSPEPATDANTAETTGPGGDDSTLVIAIAGMVTPQEGFKYYQGLAEYVGESVGREVRIVHRADYAEVNRLLEAEKVDVAFVCSGPYVAGHDEFGLRLIAAPVVNGAPQYHSLIIVPKSSDATSLASLRGKTFAFTDPESNTGYVVPRFMLTDAGEDPSTFFSETFFTYGHDVSIKYVATGEADGAAVDSLIWDYANSTDPVYTSKTRILLESEPYAVPPVVARNGLSEELYSGVRQALLTAHEDAEGKSLLDNMKIERFVSVDDSAYDSIRRMMERLGE